MPPISGGEHELNLDVVIEFEGGPSDGVHLRMILYMDNAIWKFFMLKKDLNPKSLRWFLLLQEYGFKVHDKG